MSKIFLSIIPIVIVFIIAFSTRKTLDALVIGSFVGFFIVSGPFSFLESWLEATYSVMNNPDTAWLLLVCGLFSGFIILLERSGGIAGFSNITAKFSYSRNSSLMLTWLIGIIIFVDDYLNALAIGTTMRNITDKYKVPREFLAYVINSTGAATCVLIPFSTWSAFLITNIQGVKIWGSAGFNLHTYLKIVPFIFYGWVAVLIVPLYFYGILPYFGPMKQAEKRAELTGQVIPDSMLHLSKESTALFEDNSIVSPKSSNFIVPIFLLGLVSIYTGDMLFGVFMGIFSCFVLYVVQNLLKPTELSDILIEGFQDMMPIFGILIAASILQEANELLGLTDLIAYNLQPILNPALLPLVAFILIGILAFGTGSFWGIAAISFPIILPLAQSISANIYLVCGAIISGITLGSHACFFSDAATLTCASTQINTNDYARCVLPLILLPFLISCLIYLIAGYLFS